MQVIVSRKDATNTIKLSPMNTSRGKNEQHSKKMGQFDRVDFKQSGEDVFDSLFEFDRQLKETMAYANVQKNGSLNERIEMCHLDLRISESDIELANQEETIARQTANIEHSLEDFTVPVNFDIRDDVDDETVYGKNRQRKNIARRSPGNSIRNIDISRLSLKMPVTFATQHI